MIYKKKSNYKEYEHTPNWKSKQDKKKKEMENSKKGHLQGGTCEGNDPRIDF